MALEEEYITDLSLQQYFVNKDTGEPLAGGVVYFFEDDNRNILKPIFEISGAPPNYSYSDLPNPMTLSATGTPMDADGNDVAIYYKPYDGNGDIQLYYIAVYAAGETSPQFTRDAWPNIMSATDPVGDSGKGVSNALTNPLFTDILFESGSTLTLSYSGMGTTSFDIAPGWIVQVDHTGSGSTTITRNPIAGNLGYPNNIPYTVTITAASSATSLEVIQTLYEIPGLWTKKTGTDNGYVASNISIATGTEVDMYYESPVDTRQLLLAANNMTGSIAEYRNTVQLDPSSNSAVPDNAFVDIVISLVPGQTSTFGGVQVAGMESNEQSVPFDQTPLSRIEDQSFNYYRPQLEYKPVPSHLVGWDFPLNPAQWGATYSVATLGDNTSDYVWDQTIVFQDTDDGFTAARHATGAFELTIAVENTRVALIQYIEQDVARAILNDEIAVHIAANKSTGNDVIGRVTLWYTTAALPDMGTNDSLVSAIDADGIVTAGNGTWTEVPRRNGEAARFTLTSSATENFNDVEMNGWDMEGIAAVGTATNMAIVVSFPSQAATDVIDFHSIALCSGDIATRPAPVSKQEALSACERYYETSYKTGETIGATSVENQMSIAQSSYGVSGGSAYFQNAGFGYNYRTVKSSLAPDIRVWSTDNGTLASVTCHLWNPGAGVVTKADAVLATNWTLAGADDKSATYNVNANLALPTEATNPGNSNGSGWITFQYEIDSRIGIA
jgi:hypothetical protein